MSLTRIVKSMGSMHSTRMSVRTGKTTASQAVGEVLFSREHFPKFLTASMMFSGLTGYFTMEYIQQKRWETRDALYDSVWDDHQRKQQTSKYDAMLENDKHSSWKDNVDNAMKAQ